jgi:hypothetical protein
VFEIAHADDFFAAVDYIKLMGGEGPSSPHLPLLSLLRRRRRGGRTVGTPDNRVLVRPWGDAHLDLGVRFGEGGEVVL